MRQHHDTQTILARNASALDVKAELVAGFTATVVLSILMTAKSSAGFLPQLNPIEDM
jgi:hypothetical protein